MLGVLPLGITGLVAATLYSLATHLSVVGAGLLLTRRLLAEVLAAAKAMALLLHLEQAPQDKAITAELETAAAQLQQLRVAAVEQVQSAETQRPQQVQTADQDQHHQSLEHP